MGCIGSKMKPTPETITPGTHIFVNTHEKGRDHYATMARIMPSERHESRNYDDAVVSFGFNVPFRDIEILFPLGSGNFGEVFEARYQRKRVAVKRLNLPEEMTDLEEVIQSFQLEVNILSRLEHPNIVKLLGAVQEPGCYCLITELCEGSVADLLRLATKQKIELTWDVLVNIALDCAYAVNYLHGLDPIILHRDIKAENLLITKHFGCKLTDFGLSRALERNNTAATICGTPRWLAPEVYRGETYTMRVDVYSYGIVLWELFCFTKPYVGTDPISLPYMVAYENHRPPLQSHVPEQLSSLMSRCWAASPQTRPLFQEIIDRLEAIQKEIPLDVIVDRNLAFDDPRNRRAGGKLDTLAE